MKRVFLLAATAVLSACNHIADPPLAPSDPATETFAVITGVDISKMTKTATGVYYLDLEPGTGTTVTGNQTVTITYYGYLRDGFLFGSETQTTVVLGRDGVAGLADGMLGMQVGGKRKIVIPSERGYGRFGLTAFGIPPNSTLIFDVQLFDVK
jgi:FKBP-type peptidyl-prolyl cis-trans isomerase FkpA